MGGGKEITTDIFCVINMFCSTLSSVSKEGKQMIVAYQFFYLSWDLSWTCPGMSKALLRRQMFDCQCEYCPSRALTWRSGHCHYHHYCSLTLGPPPPHVSVVQCIVAHHSAMQCSALRCSVGTSIAIKLSIVECNTVQFMLCAVCGSVGQLWGS